MPRLLKILALAVVWSIAASHSFAPAAVLKPEELDRLVAPIALSGCVAITNFEVVGAERWVRSNKNLKGIKGSCDEVIRAPVELASGDAAMDRLPQRLSYEEYRLNHDFSDR